MQLRTCMYVAVHSTVLQLLKEIYLCHAFPYSLGNVEITCVLALFVGCIAVLWQLMFTCYCSLPTLLLLLFLLPSPSLTLPPSLSLGRSIPWNHQESTNGMQVLQYLVHSTNHSSSTCPFTSVKYACQALV